MPEAASARHVDERSGVGAQILGRRMRGAGRVAIGGEVHAGVVDLQSLVQGGHGGLFGQVDTHRHHVVEVVRAQEFGKRLVTMIGRRDLPLARQREQEVPADESRRPGDEKLHSPASS